MRSYWQLRKLCRLRLKNFINFEANRFTPLLIKVKLRSLLSSFMQNISSTNHALKGFETLLKSLKLISTGFDEDMDEDLPILSDVELKGVDAKKLSVQIEILKGTLWIIVDELNSEQPNLEVLIEYRTKMAVYRQRTEALDEATSQRDDLKLKYDSLKKDRLSQFMVGFFAISQKLKEMYQVA